MLKQDVYSLNLKDLIHEYGVKESVVGLAQALQEYADEMIDMGLKERAVRAADVADQLIDMIGE